ncbi:hypothetical protein F4861DRAFT_548933 [Xylaria intraflava]|nr:hypothetical protein F4861DRAFT_548933 [Xylaria intraflava]
MERKHDEGVPTDEINVNHHVMVMRQKLKATDASYDAKQLLLRQIKSDWKRGLTDTQNHQFLEEAKDLEEKIGELQVAKIAMRASFYELSGLAADGERWNKRSHADDWTHMDLFVSRFKESSRSTEALKTTLDAKKQESWRQAVLKAYGANGNLGWCPVSAQWLPKDMLTAGHIVRHNITELAAEYLFGLSATPGGHLWSIRNGISILPMYQKMLDDAKISIVPTRDGEGLMIVVLDDGLPSDEAGSEHTNFPIGKDLDGRRLEFRNDHRPAMRYLYFNFAINVLRRQRYDADGWWRDRIYHADKIPYFATPGKWVQETTLQKLAIRIGHVSEGEAGSFLMGAGLENPSWAKDPEKDEDKTEMIVSIVENVYQGRLTELAMVNLEDT